MGPGAELEEAIRERIRREGRITFAEFMEMALFSPLGGYYTSLERVGKEGDYYTSPAAHPVFGALIALQLEQMWQSLGCPNPFTVVEMGAGSGLLAEDVLAYAPHLPSDFSVSLSYLALERFWPARGRARTSPEVQWITTNDLPLKGIVGCFLSNELLDSFPVHRVLQREGGLWEIYVTVEGDSFVEILDEPSTPFLERYLEETGVRLGEGCKAEICLKVAPWVTEVAAALERGYVLTIDYGYPAQELYSPQRREGTLLCYYRHTFDENPYQRVGRQDITAHVDLSNLIHAGARVGLTPVGLATQREFLRNLGIGAFQAALSRLGLSQRELYANRLAMLDLIKPGGLGELKVVIQSKGLPALQLDGFAPENPRRAALLAKQEELEGPLLSEAHIPLLASRYPHLDWEFKALWPERGEGGR